MSGDLKPNSPQPQYWPMTSILKQRIENRMRDLEWTTNHLSNVSGVPRPILTNWMRKFTALHDEDFTRVCDALNIAE